VAWLGPRQRTTLLAVGFQFIGFVYWQSLADRKTFISTVVSCHDNAGKVNPSQISGSGIEWRLRLWCDSVDQVDIRTKRGHWPISSLPTADFLSSERAYLYAKCFFSFRRSRDPGHAHFSTNFKVHVRAVRGNMPQLSDWPVCSAHRRKIRWKHYSLDGVAHSKQRRVEAPGCELTDEGVRGWVPCYFNNPPSFI